VQIQEKIITKTEVILDLSLSVKNKSQYKGLINDFCEQYHEKTGKPRNIICDLMVNEFYEFLPHERDWIRKRIDQKYKIIHRVNNGLLRSNKIRNEIQKLETKAGEILTTTFDYMKNDKNG